MKTLFGAAVFAIITAASAASAQSAAEITKIDRYVATVKKITGAKRKPKLIVANTADYDQEKDNWQKFASEKALEKHRERSEAYSIAYNWKSKGALVATNFTDFSPSGDWSQYRRYR